MQKLTDISIDTLKDSTEYIEMPDGTIVNNKDHIREFYSNVENKLVKEIQARLAEFNSATQIKAQQVQCTDCGKPYSVPITFDYANFFFSLSAILYMQKKYDLLSKDNLICIIRKK
jgi:hypothetical protein